MKRFDVVGIGVPVTDIFLVNPDIVSFSLETGEMRKSFIGLETGSKSPSVIQNYTGGSSANSLAALATYGDLNLGYICVVGSDHYSSILIDDLEQRGIDVTGVVRKHNFLPGVSIILTGAGGVRDRAISVDHGTGEHLSLRDLHWAEDVAKNAKWIDVTSLPGVSIPPVKEFLNELRQLPETPKIFLAPSSSMLHRDVDSIRSWIGSVDALAMNDDELFLLCGSHKLEDCFQWLLERNVPTTFVTRGGQGIMRIDGETVMTIPAVPLPRESIVNTTGAGDVAAAYLLLGLIEECDPLYGLQRAAIAGAIKITSPRLGAKSGLPTKDQIEEWLNRYRIELQPRTFTVKRV